MQRCWCLALLPLATSSPLRQWPTGKFPCEVNGQTAPVSTQINLHIHSSPRPADGSLPQLYNALTCSLFQLFQFSVTMLVLFFIFWEMDYCTIHILSVPCRPMKQTGEYGIKILCFKKQVVSKNRKNKSGQFLFLQQY